MVRAALSIFSTVVLVFIVFFFVAVWRAQPNRPAVAGPTKPLTAAVMSPTTMNAGVGEGSRPWVQQWQDGKLVSEFNADDYIPQKDGSFYVTNPISIFFMSDGQRLRVTGDHGVLYCDSSSKTPDTMFVGSNTTLRNGWLHHVHLELYPSDATTRPTLWMDTDNIHFDNDTLRMYTESITDPITNQIVTAADQVPVSMRGDDYEFDGNGLTLWWNGANRRLQRLEVRHGKRLEIKNPSKLSLPGMAPAEPQTKTASAQIQAGTPQAGSPQAGSPQAGWRLQPPPVAAEATTPLSRTRAPAHPAKVSLVMDKKPAPVQPPTPYRAVFNDNVQIKDTVRTLATADVMVVDFLQQSAKPTDQTAPSPAPKTTPPPTTTPVLGNAEAPGGAVPGNTPANPSPSATSQPSKQSKSSSTQPVNGPVTITWTGVLLVTPLETEPLMPLAPGQSVVRLVGTPVHLTPEGSEVLAATATYRNPDGAIELESPRGGVVQLKRDTGMMLTTGSLAYDPATAMAILLGPSHLEQPVGDAMMNVDWTTRGQLHMIKSAGQTQPNGVDQINLTGDVVATHPQFSLHSHQLQLNLSPVKGKESGEQLNLVTADEYVRCRLNNPGAPPDKGIDSDHLEIHTEQSNGKTVAREVIAVGDVRAFDPDQSLTAEWLDAMLLPKSNAAPATNPADPDSAAGAVDLESLHAKTHVHAVLKNGSTANSDELQITGIGNRQIVELSGEHGAILRDGKGSWLKGPVIHLVPARSAVSVNGPGSMETVRTTAATRPTDPVTPPKVFDVAWTDSMWMDSSANIVDLFGHVTAKNLDPNGTLSTITGDKAHMDLMDSPRPTTKPAAKPTSKSTASDSDPMASAAGGKQLQKLTMTGHIVGTSDLDAPDGKVLRQGLLNCDKLVYLPADGSAIIPGPGKMYVENHIDKGGDATGGKGQMAISWQKQMVYNDIARTITFTGDTVVGFEQDQDPAKAAKPAVPAKNGDNAGGNPAAVPDGRMLLKSDQVVVVLAPPEKGKPNAAASQQKVQKLIATGQVRFNAKTVELTCDEADYDPATKLLTAKGTEKDRVNVLSGTMTGLFDVVVYNSESQEVISATGSHVRAVR
jgi:hypothetical protein